MKNVIDSVKFGGYLKLLRDGTPIGSVSYPDREPREFQAKKKQDKRPSASGATIEEAVKGLLGASALQSIEFGGELSVRRRTDNVHIANVSFDGTDFLAVNKRTGKEARGRNIKEVVAGILEVNALDMATPLDNDGLEIEQIEQEDPREIKRLFDPEQIKIRTANILVDLIVSRIDHGEINLDPDFQRMDGIWNHECKSRLIESLLLRIPIPVFYVAADENEKWKVMDGRQRTSTIYDYVKNHFRLTQLEYLTTLNGFFYRDLPRQMQRRISETQLVVNVIDPGTPEEVIFNIFRRINTGDEPYAIQEIRHALHPGPIRNYLKKLAESEEFLKATGGKIKKNRMADRECVLRFLAFHIEPWEEYSEKSLDSYLGATMKKINGMEDQERDDLFADFKKAMRGAYDIFGDNAFRKRCGPNGRLGRINRALFEAWSIGLARRTDEEIRILVANREAVDHRFMSLMKDDWEFDEAISSSIGDPVRVRKRFQAIDELIEARLHASKN